MLQLILLIQRGTQSTQTPLKERQVATALQADAGRTVSAQFQVGTEVAIADPQDRRAERSYREAEE